MFLRGSEIKSVGAIFTIDINRYYIILTIRKCVLRTLLTTLAPRAIDVSRAAACRAQLGFRLGKRLDQSFQ